MLLPALGVNELPACLHGYRDEPNADYAVQTITSHKERSFCCKRLQMRLQTSLIFIDAAAIPDAYEETRCERRGTTAQRLRLTAQRMSEITTLISTQVVIGK